MKYDQIDTRPTQRERRDPAQVTNNAGGYVYQVDDAQRVRRFLILGSEGGSFYANERSLTMHNFQTLQTMATSEPVAMWKILKEVNNGNLAARHSTVLLGLAILHSLTPATHTIEVQRGEETKKLQERHPVRDLIDDEFTSFVRTGSHLFEFVQYALMFRKWGASLRRLVASWYEDRGADDLAYQMLKYQSRKGWAHRDVLRMAHPKLTGTPRGVVGYAVKGTEDADYQEHLAAGDLPVVLDQFQRVKHGDLAPTQADALTWEMLPSAALADPEVWRALITNRKLPYTAMLRNLGRMTKIGVFDQAEYVVAVGRILGDGDHITKARVHPFNVLTALTTYTGGHGFRGKLAWAPKQPIVDALDGAFYKAFQNVEPTGQRILVGLDVSASMSAPLMDSSITARIGSVAMSMATVAADPVTTDVVAFTSAGWCPEGQYQPNRVGYALSSGIQEVGLSPRRRLDDIITETGKLPWGGTDCALPILWAAAHKKEYDAFVIYSDNETWGGKVQVVDALTEYRRRINPRAKLIVVMMTATQFTIGDPTDPGTLNVVGFDSSAPAVISNFIQGKL